MADTTQRAKDVSKAVYSILERYPEARDNDRELMLRYWHEVDQLLFDDTFPETFTAKGTSPESITRARRAIQASGEFLPSEEVVKRRRTRQEAFRNHYSGE